MKNLLLTAFVLCGLFTGVACIDITPYPVVEVDAGAEEEVDAEAPVESDAGADGA